MINKIPSELEPVVLDLESRIRSGQFSTLEEFKAKMGDYMITRSIVPESPGWRAVFTPATPLDKAFQIYIMNWLREQNYGLNTTPGFGQSVHFEATRGSGLDLARKYLEQAITVLADMRNNKEKKESLSGLKDVVLVEFTHQLPCGNQDLWPKAGNRLGEVQQRLADILFRNGNLMYVNGHPETLMNSPDRYKPLVDFGGVENIFNDALFMVSEKMEDKSGFDLASSANSPAQVPHPVEKKASKAKKKEEVTQPSTMSLF